MTPFLGRPSSTAALPFRLLSGAFVLLAILSYLGPQGYAPLAALAGLAVLPPWRWRLPTTFTGRVSASLAIALLAWAAISLLWSVQPVSIGRSYNAIEKLTWVKLALAMLIMPGLALAAGEASSDQARRTALVMSWSLFALSVLIVLDSLAHASLYQAMAMAAGIDTPPDIAAVKVSQGSAAVALLMWPAHVALRRTGMRLGSVVFFAAAACAALLLGYDVGLFAAILGGLVFTAVHALGRPALRVWAAAVAAYWTLAPAIVLGADRLGLVEALSGRLPPSWIARLDIWTYTSARIAEHPIRGWGMDASRAFGLQIPLHPHDGALQVWLELGAPGALLITGLSLIAAEALARRSDARDAVAAAAAAATAFLTIGALSYGVWQEWWLGLAAFGAAACVILFRVGDQADSLSPLQTPEDAHGPPLVGAAGLTEV